MNEPSAATIRVLLVDDHPTVRQTLRRALQAYPNIEVVGEASDGEEAIARVEQLQPRIVVMDIQMGRMDGVTATRLIKKQFPQVAVIGLPSSRKTLNCMRCTKLERWRLYPRKIWQSCLKRYTGRSRERPDPRITHTRPGLYSIDQATS